MSGCGLKALNKADNCFLFPSLLECHPGLYDPLSDVVLRRHHHRDHVLRPLLRL